MRGPKFNMRWWCPNCEVEGKPIIDKHLVFFNCAICAMAMDIEITVKPLKTPDEAEAIFNSIELTKQQRTGSGNKPFKRKKS